MRSAIRRLQLCRPLSGAVIANSDVVIDIEDIGFNCAAPFRERLSCAGEPLRCWHSSFNCAAPFRERLSRVRGNPCAWHSSFNCAAPFRERLFRYLRGRLRRGSVLQLCRPLSGAVIPQWPPAPALASIVPPPFGSGYDPCAAIKLHGGHTASIVPPPFGSGYSPEPAESDIRCWASIVPPPFGSGYHLLVWHKTSSTGLQLCRPLSGAVIRKRPDSALFCHTLQLCRPLSGAVIRK